MAMDVDALHIAKSVEKRLEHYMNEQRLEEGFDPTGQGIYRTSHRMAPYDLGHLLVSSRKPGRFRGKITQKLNPQGTPDAKPAVKDEGNKSSDKTGTDGKVVKETYVPQLARSDSGFESRSGTPHIPKLDIKGRTCQHSSRGTATECPSLPLTPRLISSARQKVPLMEADRLAKNATKLIETLPLDQLTAMHSSRFHPLPCPHRPTPKDVSPRASSMSRNVHALLRGTATREYINRTEMRRIKSAKAHRAKSAKMGTQQQNKGANDKGRSKSALGLHRPKTKPVKTVKLYDDDDDDDNDSDTWTSQYLNDHDTRSEEAVFKEIPRGAGTTVHLSVWLSEQMEKWTEDYDAEKESTRDDDVQAHSCPSDERDDSQSEAIVGDHGNQECTENVQETVEEKKEEEKQEESSGAAGWLKKSFTFGRKKDNSQDDDQSENEKKDSKFSLKLGFMSKKEKKPQSDNNVVQQEEKDTEKGGKKFGFGMSLRKKSAKDSVKADVTEKDETIVEKKEGSPSNTEEKTKEEETSVQSETLQEAKSSTEDPVVGETDNIEATGESKQEEKTIRGSRTSLKKKDSEKLLIDSKKEAKVKGDVVKVAEERQEEKDNAEVGSSGKRMSISSKQSNYKGPESQETKLPSDEALEKDEKLKSEVQGTSSILRKHSKSGGKDEKEEKDAETVDDIKGHSGIGVVEDDTKEDDNKEIEAGISEKTDEGKSNGTVSTEKRHSTDKAEKITGRNEVEEGVTDNSTEGSSGDDRTPTSKEEMEEHDDILGKKSMHRKSLTKQQSKESVTKGVTDILEQNDAAENNCTDNKNTVSQEDMSEEECKTNKQETGSQSSIGKLSNSSLSVGQPVAHVGEDGESNGGFGKGANKDDDTYSVSSATYHMVYTESPKHTKLPEF